MQLVNGHFNWTAWMFMICITIFKSMLVNSAEECFTCEKHTCKPYNHNCYCEHEQISNTIQHWDGWRGRYDTTKEFLYSTAKCYGINQNLTLKASTCPERPCRYITFISSSMRIIPINFLQVAPHLQQVYLNSSQVESLQVGAFSGLPELEILHLNDNKLTKISPGPLNTLIALKTLDIHSNEITTIEDHSFLGLNSLESLDLSKNRIRAISYSVLEPLVNLRLLILSYNFISVVDFNTGKLNELTTLYLNHNNIEHIQDCFEETALGSLFLQDNEISYFNCSRFPNDLSILDLANNKISILDSIATDELWGLTTLNLSKNAIASVPIGTFKDLKNLVSLDLSQNDITQMKTGVFSGAKNIEYLNLSDINLEKLDANAVIPLANLKILDISSNNLSSWDPYSFDHLDYLEKVCLGGNNFSCKVASSIFRHAKVKNVSLVYEFDYTVENIKGLACGYDKTEQQFTPKNVTSMVNWNEIRNSLSNISNTIIKNTENIFLTKKFLMSNAENTKTVENSLKAEIKTQNNLMKTELLANISQKQDSSYFEKNISSQVQTLYNAIIDLKKIMESNENNQASLINNNKTFNKENNLETSLYQLKILIALCFCISLCILVLFKIVSCCCRSKKRKTNSFDLGQELPILSVTALFKNGDYNIMLSYATKTGT